MFTLYANFKGGTGKSTVVFNMGLWLAARGKAVTVCDLDPQRTVSDVAEIRTEMGYVPPLTITHELPGKSGARGEWLADVGLSDTDAMRAAIRAAGRIVVPVRFSASSTAPTRIRDRARTPKPARRSGSCRGSSRSGPSWCSGWPSGGRFPRGSPCSNSSPEARRRRNSTISPGRFMADRAYHLEGLTPC